MKIFIEYINEYIFFLFVYLLTKKVFVDIVDWESACLHGCDLVVIMIQNCGLFIHDMVYKASVLEHCKYWHCDQKIKLHLLYGDPVSIVLFHIIWCC